MGSGNETKLSVDWLVVVNVPDAWKFLNAGPRIDVLWLSTCRGLFTLMMALTRVAILIIQILPPLGMTVFLPIVWIVGLVRSKDFERKIVNWVLDATPREAKPEANNEVRKCKCLLSILLCIYCYLLALVVTFTFWTQFLFTVTTECRNEDSCFVSNGTSLAGNDCGNLPGDLNLVCYRWALNYAGAAGSVFGIIALMKVLIKGIMLLMDLVSPEHSQLCFILSCALYTILFIIIVVVVIAFEPLRNALFYNGFLLDIGALLQFILTVITCFIAPLIVPLSKI